MAKDLFWKRERREGFDKRKRRNGLYDKYRKSPLGKETDLSDSKSLVGGKKSLRNGVKNAQSGGLQKEKDFFVCSD
jgi:hypothetical protein